MSTFGGGRLSTSTLQRTVDTLNARVLSTFSRLSTLESYHPSEKTMPYAGISWTTAMSTPNSTATSISVAGTYVKGAGTTSETHASSTFTTSTSNRITFTGTESRVGHIVMQATVSLTSGTNQGIGIALYHWDDSAGTGSLLPHSECITTIASTDSAQITSHADAVLEENDYIELWIANHTNTNNVLIEYAYLFVMGSPV